MEGGPALEFALVRVQARYGRRPGANVWLGLEAIADFAPLLEAIHDTGLREWVAGVVPGGSIHGIEGALRRKLRERIAEVAGWLPSCWRPAVRWTAHLGDLPALLHLMRGEPAAEWMRHDAALAPYATDTLPARHVAFLASELAPLLAAWRERRAITAAWVDGWRVRWPSACGTSTVPLDDLVRRVATHIEGLDAVSVADMPSARQQLKRRLEAEYRRHGLHPVQPFLYLLLAALDLERLRSMLVSRALCLELLS